MALSRDIQNNQALVCNLTVRRRGLEDSGTLLIQKLPKVFNYYQSPDVEFVHFEIDFKNQFAKLSEYLHEIDEVFALDKMRSSLSELQYFQPDVLSMELSYEKNIFYTLKKGKHTAFFSVSLEKDIEREDEAFVSIFEDKATLPNFSGSLEETINHMANSISRRSIIVERQNNFHELSY